MTGLTENEIVKIWRYQLLDAERLVTEEGEPLQIIYPGWLNDDQGPDFKDAVILGGCGLIRGDVEVHVRSSSWSEHGHHLNAAYNRVILHVVMWHGAGALALLQNGGQAPTLALSKYINIPLSQWSGLDCFPAGSNLSCLVSSLSPEALAGFLDVAGEKRFLMKVTSFQKDLARTEASQSLYQGIMSALGYSRNKLPFLELARRLPLCRLESMTRDEITDAEWLIRRQALLLGTSGLLFRRENGFGGEWTDELVKLWASSPHTRARRSTERSHRSPEGSPRGAMSPDVWHLLRVRPNNSPLLRLVAMSYLLLRYRRKGLLEGLVGLVREAPVTHDGYKRLEAGLVVNVDSCAGYPGFISGSGAGRLTLLGRGRAADIIVNVLLPFTLAWSQANAQAELGKKALELYNLIPRLPVNSVERHMTGQLGLSRGLVSSARRQQGLIHIYKNLCALGRCERCHLSHP